MLAAAIELLRDGGIDMDGVEAGDLTEMKAARAGGAAQAPARHAAQETSS